MEPRTFIFLRLFLFIFIFKLISKILLPHNFEKVLYVTIRIVKCDDCHMLYCTAYSWRDGLINLDLVLGTLPLPVFPVSKGWLID